MLQLQLLSILLCCTIYHFYLCALYTITLWFCDLRIDFISSFFLFCKSVFLILIFSIYILAAYNFICYNRLIKENVLFLGDE